MWAGVEFCGRGGIWCSGAGGVYRTGGQAVLIKGAVKGHLRCWYEREVNRQAVFNDNVRGLGANRGVFRQRYVLGTKVDKRVDEKAKVGIIGRLKNSGSGDGRTLGETRLRLFLEILLAIFLCQAIVIVLLYAVSSQSILDIVLDAALLGLITIGLVYKLTSGLLRSAFRRRERAEYLLNASGQMYRTLFESSSDAIILVSCESGRAGIVSVNPAAAELFGFGDEQEMISRSWAELSGDGHGEASAGEFQRMTQKAAANDTHSFEWKFRRSNGTEFCAEVLLGATRVNGQVFIQATVRDLTNRKELETKLAEHVKKLDCLYGLSKLVEQPDMPLGEIFQQTTDLVRNAYRFPEATAVRITFDGIQYKSENFRKTEVSQFAGIKAGEEKAGSIEVYYLGAEGGSMFLEQGRNLLDVFADRLGVIAERRRAAERLQLFRSLIDRSNDSIFMIEPQWGRFIDVNERACEELGYSREEMLDKTLGEIEQGLAEHKAWQEFAGRVREQTSTTLEGVFRRKDGSSFPVEVTVRFISRQEESYLVAVARDVTERKKAEARQQQLLEEVAGANRELKDFAYIVSHDLKAPLRGIKALTEWLNADYGEKLDAEGKEQMGLLVSRVGRMHNLIDGVLQYSRVGRIKEEHSAIDLNKVVAEAIDMISVPEHIKVTVKGELPTVKFEPTRIAQLFQNLISNAAKYMDKPEGWIKVSCVEQDGFWKFGVSDNGPGIAAEHFEKIFKIFQTLQARDQFESTGVGLTLVKKIVEMYDGRIWVESEVGKGTTFWFTLPKQEVESPAPIS